MNATRSDYSVNFWFWGPMNFPVLYVKRIDKNTVYSYRRDTVYDSAFRDDDYQGFFSSADQGKAFPIILSSNPL